MFASRCGGRKGLRGSTGGELIAIVLIASTDSSSSGELGHGS